MSAGLSLLSHEGCFVWTELADVLWQVASDVFINNYSDSLMDEDNIWVSSARLRKTDDRFRWKLPLAIWKWRSTSLRLTLSKDVGQYIYIYKNTEDKVPRLGFTVQFGQGWELQSYLLDFRKSQPLQGRVEGQLWGREASLARKTENQQASYHIFCYCCLSFVSCLIDWLA